MAHIRRLFYIAITFTVIYSCGNSQSQTRTDTRLAGGPCEGCEAIFEYGDKVLTSIDTLPDFQKRAAKLKVTGTIYQSDGTTPAEGVVLYVYHTDSNGIYPSVKSDSGWAKRYGHLRGWMKTESNGAYTFYTQMPGPYPDDTDPAHIHATILEPGGKYYWLDSYHFEGDPFLKATEVPASHRGGGNGLLKLKNEDGLRVGTRDIVLGRNVPEYD